MFHNRLFALHTLSQLCPHFHKIRPSYLRQHSNTLNLHIRPQRKLLSSNTSPTRLRLTPVLLINLVHLRKILHIIDEDVDFHDVFDCGPGGFEDGGEIFYALVLQNGQLASRMSVLGG